MLMSATDVKAGFHSQKSFDHCEEFFYSKKKLARPYVGVKDFNHEED